MEGCRAPQRHNSPCHGKKQSSIILKKQLITKSSDQNQDTNNPDLVDLCSGNDPFGKKKKKSLDLTSIFYLMTKCRH